MSDRRPALDELLALRAASTALLVVDMQRGFVEPGEAMEVPPAREAIPRIQRAALDIIARAYGRIASAKEVADVVGGWPPIT